MRDPTAARRELARFALALALAPALEKPAHAAKGAAELDLGFYLKSLARGSGAAQDDALAARLPLLSESAKGPPDAEAVEAVSHGARVALSRASGLALDKLDARAADVIARLRPSDVGVQPGTRTFAYARELSATSTLAAELLPGANERDAFARAFGLACVEGIEQSAAARHAPRAAGSSLPAAVRAVDEYLGALARARLLDSWRWLADGALTPVDADDLAELGAAAAACERWAVALELRGSPTLASASRLSTALPPTLLPEPAVAGAVQAARAAACGTGAGQATSVGWDLFFVQDYAEETVTDVRALSVIVQLAFGGR